MPKGPTRHNDAAQVQKNTPPEIGHFQKVQYKLLFSDVLNLERILCANSPPQHIYGQAALATLFHNSDRSARPRGGSNFWVLSFAGNSNLRLLGFTESQA